MNKKPSNVVILGSTGSIGRQALEVVDRHPDRYRVIALAANDKIDQLQAQSEKYKPLTVSLNDPGKYKELKERLGSPINVLCGVEGMCELASMEDVDIVLVAVSGSVGIEPTLTAIRKSRRVALANKETLVAAGDIVMQAARDYQAEIIPVDSEHSAIYQCLQMDRPYVKNLWLTASGGPFRDYSREQLAAVTVDMALSHPNWDMGAKITVDSATMMNKGLEVIEAHHLFAVGYDKIKVLVQKESVIHSMVEFIDGSFLAHLGAADMRIPIQYALSYPERFESPARHLDFFELQAIHFAVPDTERFPALALALEAGRRGGTLPAVMNAANEIAVHQFLQHTIGFTDIPRLVEQVMLRHQVIESPALQEILEADAWAREYCRGLISKEVV